MSLHFTGKDKRASVTGPDSKAVTLKCPKVGGGRSYAKTGFWTAAPGWKRGKPRNGHSTGKKPGSGTRRLAGGWVFDRANLSGVSRWSTVDSRGDRPSCFPGGEVDG